MDTTEEIWKPIPDFDDYEVSSLGHVRRVKNFTPWHRREPRMRRGRHRYGYWVIGLSRHGKMHHFTVHSLVARAFIGERPQGLQVAHLDGDPTNARLSNLAYVTPKENSSHKKLHGTLLFGESMPQGKLTEMQARIARRLPRSACMFYSNLIGVGYGVVWHVQEGNTWRHLGADHAAA